MSLRRNGRDLGFYLAMVGPGVLLYLLIIAFPIVASVLLGFTDYNIADLSAARNNGMAYMPNFVGGQWYSEMFADPLFQRAIWNNMVVIAVSVFGQIPLGFILAYILYRKLVKGQAFFQAMVFLPNFISTIVIGILWKRIFSATGPAEQFLQWITGNPEAAITWFQSPDTAMIPVSFVLLFMYTGFYMVIFLANLQKLDSGLVEAAQIDGASEPQIFMKIIVPMLAGVIAVNAILAISGSLKGFDLIFAMTSQGITRRNAIVLPIYMYEFAFATPKPNAQSFGAAVSNIIVALSIALIMISNFVKKKLGSGEVY